MKKTIKALKIASLLTLILLAFVACDKDFSSLESDIQGSENFITNSDKFPVITYNKKLNAVQTNDISSNLLGIYNDDIYGTTIANIVTQVTLSTFNPDFGNNAVIDSVMLTIPYYVTTEVVDSENQYEIDSLFGDTPIKLSIYENNYFLKDNNPENIAEFQKYYSNGNGVDFNGVHRGDLLYQKDIFPSNEAIDIELSDEEEEIITPSLYIDLNTQTLDFWKNLLKVDDSDSHTELSNSNNFKNYFRGLYFNATLADNEVEGNMVMLDFSKAKIEVKYTNDGDELDDAGMTVRERQTYQLNLTGNRLNIFENDPINNIIANADALANTTEGDEKLYIKGGEGAIAVVNLFAGIDSNNDGLSDAYDDFIATYKDQRLINEANLVFYVDETNTQLNSEQEPERVIIYDIKNNIPVADYFLDITNTNSPESSKAFHSTVLERDSENNGVKYKIRLTEHLNNILLRDSTNLQLGLMVTTNINEVFQYSILDSEDKITSGTVMSPKGTILHGGNENVAEEKRVQLEIFYTEPKN